MLVVTYEDTWPRARILKGQLHNGRPCKWRVEVRFAVPGEAKRQELVFTTSGPCQLTELGTLIERRLRVTEWWHGGITNIGWTATHWR